MYVGHNVDNDLSSRKNIDRNVADIEADNKKLLIENFLKKKFYCVTNIFLKCYDHRFPYKQEHRTEINRSPSC